jgi:hypothetical protein
MSVPTTTTALEVFSSIRVSPSAPEKAAKEFVANLLGVSPEVDLLWSDLTPRPASFFNEPSADASFATPANLAMRVSERAGAPKAVEVPTEALPILAALTIDAFCAVNGIDPTPGAPEPSYGAIEDEEYQAANLEQRDLDLDHADSRYVELMNEFVMAKGLRELIDGDTVARALHRSLKAAKVAKEAVRESDELALTSSLITFAVARGMEAKLDATSTVRLRAEEVAALGGDDFADAVLLVLSSPTKARVSDAALAFGDYPALLNGGFTAVLPKRFNALGVAYGSSQWKKLRKEVNEFLMTPGTWVTTSAGRNQRDAVLGSVSFDVLMDKLDILDVNLVRSSRPSFGDELVNWLAENINSVTDKRVADLMVLMEKHERLNLVRMTSNHVRVISALMTERVRRS